MINIYRTVFSGQRYDSPMCEFHTRDSVGVDEVEFVERTIGGSEHNFARPAKKGNWAFGGSFLYTSNGIFTRYNRPIPLHDWNLDLEKQPMGD